MAMRMNPIDPSIPPSVSPENISRRITYHQSFGDSSFSAIARMISVAACDPLLPPLLMISGTNIVSTSTLSSSTWKCCIAVAVSISLRNSIMSQPARFCIIVTKPVFTYGRSSDSSPPNCCMSLVSFSSASSITSSTVTTPITTLLLLVTGSATRSYSLNLWMAVSILSCISSFT